MTDQNTFMETLHEVSEIIRTAPEPMTEEEILTYFKDMELSKEQQALVIEYLSKPHDEELPADADDDNKDAEDAKSEDDEFGLDAYTDETLCEAKEAEPEITLPDTPVFKMYMEEVNALPKFKKAEVDKMYEKLLSGDESVIADLSGVWLKKVLEMAVKFGSAKVLMDDVIQEGNMGLYMALRELTGNAAIKNPKKEIEKAIEQAIKDYVSEATGEVDEENTILGKVTLVYEAEKLLEEELGRKPDISELADYTKLDENEIEDIKNVAKEKALK